MRRRSYAEQCERIDNEISERGSAAVKAELIGCGPGPWPPSREAALEAVLDAVDRVFPKRNYG